MKEVIVHDVGMRDGLQMEAQIVPMEQKVKWIQDLMSSGIDIIQVGSFVHPKKVPQMADTDQLFLQFVQHSKKSEKVIFSGLVLNEKGLERGLACGVEMFCMGVSASETHSYKNTGMNVEEATDRIIAMARETMAAKKRVQVSVQSAFGCGYEGVVPQERVLGIVRKYLEAGLRTLSLADTAGHANPEQVQRLYDAIFSLDDTVECACHFHNTYGLGLANCYAAMKAGVKYFESAFGGLGGCPFTAIAAGNICTEDLVHLLHRMNMRNDIKLDRLIEIAKAVGRFFNRDLPGFIYKSGPIPDIKKTG